ncbi:hypothetical protein BYT27DRAFT_6840104 [Phlegmacium glaucopus]|nr:hypothetical protein BYT27DRAFT_6840104 [Phlegmacium glaucopus]
MTQTHRPNSLGAPFAMAHGDLLIEIALFLETRVDILNFCLTSQYVFSNVSPVLYETVLLQSAEQCSVTLGMLQRRFDIARHVRELIIRPQAKYHNHFNAFDNATVSSVVRQVAGAMCLDALAKFEWDAEDMPFFEDMWFALRLGCPQLRYVGTSIGSRLPNLNSHFFDFRDLKGFSLSLKAGFYDSHVDIFLEEDQPVFVKIWDMLIRRCPHLEELTIDGLSVVPADIHLLVEGRWPALKKLALGDISIDWFPRSLNPVEKRPFVAFLEAHPYLESLSLSRHTVQPNHFALLDPASLNRLTSFSGTHQLLQALPHIHHLIKSLTICDPVETRDMSVPAIASLLRELTSLTNLKIAFTLHSMYDSGNLLRSLIHSCPRLRHLDLTCGHKPSFQLDTFAKAIRGFPKLRTLHLAIVKYPGDETLASGAIRIARNNPHLHCFSLAFIPPVYPVPLPFSMSYRPFFIPFPTFAFGSFKVSCDEHGLPVILSAVENCKFHWPWGFGVSSCSRKYIKDLRPNSGSRKAGFLGILSLIIEQSSAGEEIRLILFCTFLAFLAACGISANGVNRQSRLALANPEYLEY